MELPYLHTVLVDMNPELCCKEMAEYDYWSITTPAILCHKADIPTRKGKTTNYLNFCGTLRDILMTEWKCR
jgi:hypothetical protein